MQWSNLINELNNIGNLLIENIRRLVPYASGRLSNSLATTIRETYNGYDLILNSENYLKFIESGRRPGAKLPPIEPIKEWCRIKGIPVNAAFPIAKSISLNGISPKPLIEPSMPEGINDRISSAVEKDVNVEINKIINNLI